MLCKACGTENAKGATVCSSCGRHLAGSAGAQVWPKDPSRLTEFKPSDKEKAELARVLGQLNNAIGTIEGVGGANTGEAADPESPAEPGASDEPPAEPESVAVSEPTDVVLPIEEVVENAIEQAPEQAENQMEDFQAPTEAPEETAVKEDVPKDDAVQPATGEELQEIEEPQAVEKPEELQESQATEEPQEAAQDEAAQDDPANDTAAESKKRNRGIIAVVAIAIVIAAIIGIVWFIGQQSSRPATDMKSYAGEWVLVEGDEASLSRSNIADLKDRGLECTLLLKDDGSGSLVLFNSPDMAVEWSIDQESKTASGTIEDASTFELKLTDNGVAMVDKTGKAMYFERK